MLHRSLSVGLAVLALVLFVGQMAQAEDKIHEGKFVSGADNKFTMTDNDGTNRHTHSLTTDAKITCDDKECKLEDLKQGCFLKVTVMTDDKGKKWVNKIEARTKE